MAQNKATIIAIVGCAGIPAAYGGFETLAENLARYHESEGISSKLLVYCSSNCTAEKSLSFHGAELIYIPLPANGIASVLYDGISLLHAAAKGCTDIILLGISGAIFIPLIKIITSTRVITNIDGIEWKRNKWNRLAQCFLRLSEALAIRFSDTVIADNEAIAEYVLHRYGRDCQVIAYGGDHAISPRSTPPSGFSLPRRYALGLCRIEPENNVAMILRAFTQKPSLDLVFIGNWRNSSYGQELHSQYSTTPGMHLLDPIYDTSVLRFIRDRAAVYVHGHSAGGTNPSLVEVMHFGIPILAYDCSYNRYTTENSARYFRDSEEIRTELSLLSLGNVDQFGHQMKEIAARRYTWAKVAAAYFNLIGKTVD